MFPSYRKHMLCCPHPWRGLLGTPWLRVRGAVPSPPALGKGLLFLFLSWWNTSEQCSALFAAPVSLSVLCSHGRRAHTQTPWPWSRALCTQASSFRWSPQSPLGKQETHSPNLTEISARFSHKSEASPSHNEAIVRILSGQLWKCFSKSILQRSRR